jgi:hypothetical protein
MSTRQHAEAISQGSNIQELADLQPAFGHSFENKMMDDR